MIKTFLPFLFHQYPAMKDAFAKRAITFGMAGEYLSFESSVQAPIIKQHAATDNTDVVG